MVVVRGGRGRHPELLGLQGSSQESENAGGSESTSGSGTSASAGSKVIEAPRPEDVDERYRRADFSDRFQYESRQAFARCLVGGEPRMALAEAALHASAEDDAIASLSSVPFPVGPWLDRIDRLVDQVCATHLPRAAAAAGGGGGGGGGIAAAAAAAASGPAAAGGGAEEGGGSEGLSTAAAAQAAGLVAAVERFLWEEAGFRMPDYGRSNLPPNARVDHAGVWEDARLGYLHETLVRRLGHPACLGLLLGEVCARLLERGRLPCAAAVDTRAFVLLPRAVPLPQLPREVVLSRRGPAQGPQGEQGQQGRLLNTTTSEVLVEMLRHLKRSFWPFAWDSAADPTGSHGGFRAAAKAAAGEEMSAALAAIGKVAAWRLERGIWTSPGAGDLRRCVASAERLVLLAGERCPEERRDLAVLLVHAGRLGAARLELRTYLATALPAAAVAAAAEAAAPSASPSVPAASTFSSGTVGSTYASGYGGPDPFDLALCRRLLALLEGLGPELAAAEPAEPLGVEATLRAPPPWERLEAAPRRSLPLTW